MSRRVVYDTMVFLQWAMLPPNRKHATVTALYDGLVQLCMSQPLLSEIQDVLTRPEMRLRSPNLTPGRVRQILDEIMEKTSWIANIPSVFSWEQHPDDDHIFNLAIEAKAEYLVTWESRMLKISTDVTTASEKLRNLAPQLKIITPRQLSDSLKST